MANNIESSGPDLCVLCQQPRLRFGHAVGADGEVCSGACRKALDRARNGIRQYFAQFIGDVPVPRCEGCGGPTKVAVSSGRPQKFCSASCRLRTSRPNGGQKYNKTCPVCANGFETLTHGKVFCSAECRDVKRREKARAEAGGCTHRRRAEKFGGKFEFIDPMEIFRRDEWVCQICLAKVDQDVVWPHKLSATLDHIIPLSRGGDHVASNVRLAHWGCNSKKSNAIDHEVFEQWGGLANRQSS